MIYKILADTIVVIHFAWILFMLLGFILTLCGLFRKGFLDRWLFRTLHLFGIVYVSLLAIMGKYCPLTIWENSLRAKYDPTLTYSGSCIVHYLEKLIYLDVDPLAILIPTISIALFTIVAFIIRPPAKVRNLVFSLRLRIFKCLQFLMISTIIGWGLMSQGYIDSLSCGGPLTPRRGQVCR